MVYWLYTQQPQPPNTLFCPYIFHTRVTEQESSPGSTTSRCTSTTSRSPHLSYVSGLILYGIGLGTRTSGRPDPLLGSAPSPPTHNAPNLYCKYCSTVCTPYACTGRIERATLFLCLLATKYHLPRRTLEQVTMYNALTADAYVHNGAHTFRQA